MRNGSRSRWRAKHGRQRIVRVELRAARRSLGGANRRVDGVETCKEGPNPVERSTREPLPLRVAPRCLARTRSGTPCQKPVAKGKEALPAPRRLNGAYRHGLYTREAIAEAEEMPLRPRSRRGLRPKPAYSNRRVSASPLLGGFGTAEIFLDFSPFGRNCLSVNVLKNNST